jgi:hypothetical protein
MATQTSREFWSYEPEDGRVRIVEVVEVTPVTGRGVERARTETTKLDLGELDATELRQLIAVATDALVSLATAHPAPDAT